MTGFPHPIMKPGRPQREHRHTRSRHRHAPNLESIITLGDSRIIHAVKRFQGGHEIRPGSAIPASLTLQEISQRGLRVSPQPERVPAETIRRPVQSRIPDPVPHPRHNPWPPLHSHLSSCFNDSPHHSMRAGNTSPPACRPPPSPRQTTRRHPQASGSCYNGKHEHHERHSQGQQA